MSFAMTLNWANAYCANRLYSETWDSADDARRAKSVRMATNMILACFDFADGAFFINDAGEEDCVDAVKNGIMEQAIYLLSMDPTKVNELLTMGLASGSAAGASATFSKEFIAPLVCDSAKSFIGNYGYFVDHTGNGARVESYNLIW